MSFHAQYSRLHEWKRNPALWKDKYIPRRLLWDSFYDFLANWMNDSWTRTILLRLMRFVKIVKWNTFFKASKCRNCYLFTYKYHMSLNRFVQPDSHDKIFISSLKKYCLTAFLKEYSVILTTSFYDMNQKI